MLLQGLLDSPCGGDAETLVDLQRLCQVHCGFTGVAVLEAGPAESFQGARFLQESAEIACEARRLHRGRPCQKTNHAKTSDLLPITKAVSASKRRLIFAAPLVRRPTPLDLASEAFEFCL